MTNSKMEFLMIVNDPEVAAFVAARGVSRLFVDLEIEGKVERQGHLSTVISDHKIEDVSAVRQSVPDGHVLVRVNPLSPRSKAEIDEVIDRGADSVMLPMFRTADDLAMFQEIVAGRCGTLPLVETVAALNALPDMIQRGLISEVHIGLNDLHLELGLSFMFELLVNGMLEEPCARLREAGLKFGIGGLARDGEGTITPHYLIGEHVRLGSSMAILSRSFHREAKSVEAIQQDMDFVDEISKLQKCYQDFLNADADALERNHRSLTQKIADLEPNLSVAGS